MIIGKVPPPYLSEALKNTHVARYHLPNFSWVPEEQYFHIDSDSITLSHLLEKNATEGLLEYTEIGKRAVLQESILNCEKYAAGSLTNDIIGLSSGPLQTPVNFQKLCMHGLACQFNYAALIAFQIVLCGPSATRCTAHNLIQNYAKLPLRERKEGKTLKEEMKNHEPEILAELVSNLIEAIIKFFEHPNFENQATLNLKLGKIFKDAKEYKQSERGIQLSRCIPDFVARSGHYGNYAMGTAGSSTLRLAAERLRPYQSKEALTGKSVDEIYDIIFRDRSRLDYKSTMSIREEMLTSSEKIVNYDFTKGIPLSDIGRMAFFDRVFQKACERARSFASLITKFSHLKLELDDFCLDFSSYVKIRQQTHEIKKLLMKYHSDDEIEAAEVNLPFEYHLETNVLENEACPIRTVTGMIDVLIRSDCKASTAIIVRTKNETTLEDEAFTLASAAMYSVERAILVDTCQGRAMVYNVRPWQRLDIIKALFKGMIDSDVSSDYFEYPSDEAVSLVSSLQFETRT